MGTGIALVAARSVVKKGSATDFNKVTIFDSIPQSLQKSEKFADNWISKEVSKNRLTEDEGQ